MNPTLQEGQNPVLIAYEAIRPKLRTGNLLLARACDLGGRLISHVTSSEYVHASMIGFAGRRPHDVLMLGETRQHKDGRLIALSSEIRAWPGYYDVYRLNAGWKPSVAWAFICRAAGSRYSLRHNLRVWLRIRLGASLIAPILNSDSPEWPRNCSALVHAAIRAAGGPSIRDFDADVVPGDLADPALSSYVATIYWSKDQINQHKEKER